MRVLAVTNMWPTDKHPQLGTHIRQLVVGLQQSGVEIDVAHFNRREQGMHVYRKIVPEIRARLKQQDFDLLHVTYGDVLAERATQLARELPVIVSFCGSDLMGEKLAGVVRKLVSAYGVISSHKAARRATGVIVKSSNLFDTLPSNIDRTKVRIIPNGVDMQRFRPIDRDTCCRELGWATDRLHILFPSNMGFAVKRLPLARAAFQRVLDLGINAELHLLHGIQHSDVPLWLNASDVLLITSAHEGSPNIVKEALACNRPIVSVDVGDIAERIQGIEECHISDANDVELARCLHSVHRGSAPENARAAVSSLALSESSNRLIHFYADTIERFSCSRGRTKSVRRIGLPAPAMKHR